MCLCAQQQQLVQQQLGVRVCGAALVDCVLCVLQGGFNSASFAAAALAKKTGTGKKRGRPKSAAKTAQQGVAFEGGGGEGAAADEGGGGSGGAGGGAGPQGDAAGAVGEDPPKATTGAAKAGQGAGERAAEVRRATGKAPTIVDAFMGVAASMKDIFSPSKSASASGGTSSGPEARLSQLRAAIGTPGRVWTGSQVLDWLEASNVPDANSLVRSDLLANGSMLLLYASGSLKALSPSKAVEEFYLLFNVDSVVVPRPAVLALVHAIETASLSQPAAGER